MSRTAGRIAADGIDLRRFEVDEWRPRLSTGFQDFSRFEFVARETVGVGNLPTIDEVPAVEAALVRAGADDIPGTLPAGLETQLGRDWEGGVDLSGGEWQKLALGRAFMRMDPLLVILDEPTAAIDAQTEHALFERIAAEVRRDERGGTVTILVLAPVFDGADGGPYRGARQRTYSRTGQPRRANAERAALRRTVSLAVTSLSVG